MVALLHWWTVSNMTDFIACGHVGLHNTHPFHQRTSPSSDIFFERNENSPFLFSTLDINLCQFPGVFCLSQIHIVGACPSFPLVSARYWSQIMSTLDDRFSSWRSRGQKNW